MKVEAIVRRPVEYVDAEIDPTKVIKQLKNDWIKENKPDYRAEYINYDGVWESWIDTHGSGITDYYGKATEDQLEMKNAFNLILDYTSKTKKECK